VKVTMILCDSAQVSDGKLHLLGGGWTVTGPGPVPSAVAMIVEVPWDQANTTIPFTLQLRDADGQPVMQEGPMGPAPVMVDAAIEVGRPPGVPAGTPLTVPLALGIPPLELPGGQRFSWECTLAGETREDWHLAFSTRAAPPARGGPGDISMPPY
jgi:hypothetical protein